MSNILIAYKDDDMANLHRMRLERKTPKVPICIVYPDAQEMQAGYGVLLTDYPHPAGEHVPITLGRDMIDAYRALNPGGKVVSISHSPAPEIGPYDQSHYSGNVHIYPPRDHNGNPRDFKPLDKFLEDVVNDVLNLNMQNI